MKRHPWIGALIVAAASFAVFSNTLGFEFVWDDTQMIVRDKSIESARTLPAALVKPLGYYGEEKPEGSLWRPALTLTFFADTQVWGKSRPWGYHLTSVLIHAAAAVFFYLLLCRAVGPGWVALAAALIFALHPVHSESISGVNARGTPLSGLFVLAAFLLWPKRRWLSAAAYLAAMYSKETAVPLFGVLLAYDVWALKSRSAAETLRRVGPAGAALAFYFLTRFWALGGLGSAASDAAVSEYASWSNRLWIQPVYLAEYVKMVLWPAGLHHWRELYFPRQFFEPAYFAPFLIFTAALFAVWRSFKSGPGVGMGLVWAAMFYTVIQNLFFLSNSPVKESWLYLPLMGVLWWAAAAASAAGKWTREQGWGSAPARAAVIAALVLAAALGAAAWHQNRVWKDELTLFEHTSRHVRRDPMIFSNLGVAYAKLGRFDQAEAAFRKALAIDPADLNANFNLELLAKDRERKAAEAQTAEAAKAAEERMRAAITGTAAPGEPEDPADRAEVLEETQYCLEDIEVDIDRVPGLALSQTLSGPVFSWGGRPVADLTIPALEELLNRCTSVADTIRMEDEEDRRSHAR